MNPSMENDSIFYKARDEITFCPFPNFRYAAADISEWK